MKRRMVQRAIWRREIDPELRQSARNRRHNGSVLKHCPYDVALVQEAGKHRVGRAMAYC